MQRTHVARYSAISSLVSCEPKDGIPPLPSVMIFAIDTLSNLLVLRLAALPIPAVPSLPWHAAHFVQIQLALLSLVRGVSSLVTGASTEEELLLLQAYNAIPNIQTEKIILNFIPEKIS